MRAQWPQKLPPLPYPNPKTALAPQKPYPLPKNRPCCPKTALLPENRTRYPKNRTRYPKTALAPQKPYPLPENRPCCPKTALAARKPYPLSENRTRFPKTVPAIRKPYPLPKNRTRYPKTALAARKPYPLSENRTRYPKTALGKIFQWPCCLKRPLCHFSVLLEHQIFRRLRFYKKYRGDPWLFFIRLIGRVDEIVFYWNTKFFVVQDFVKSTGGTLVFFQAPFPLFKTRCTLQNRSPQHPLLKTIYHSQPPKKPFPSPNPNPCSDSLYVQEFYCSGNGRIVFQSPTNQDATD